MSKSKYSDERLNELQESVFFKPPTPPQATETVRNIPSVEPKRVPKEAKKEPEIVERISSSPTEKNNPEKSNASTIASEQASMLASSQNIVEAIRKSVKNVGKEVSFVRLTPEEKKQLVDIAYTYKSRGIKTSENEISRVGINYMLEDYQENGAESILAKVLEALND